jgi:hypothetical protein
MATVIGIPDLPALSAIEPHKRFICLVVLYAAAESVGQVRFEQRQDDWAILQLQDGSWVEYLPPVDRAAAVGRTLRRLTRRPGLLGRLRPADPSGAFSLRVGRGSAIDCRVARDGADYLLSVEPRESAGEQARELLRSHLESYRELIDRSTAEAEA